MDPASRRMMWKIIENNIKGKAAILTTHSMEEAEELCTDIGIMVKGKLQCSGSPQELKDKYGDGYQLDLKVAISQVDKVKEFIEKTLFKNPVLVEEHYGRITYSVPKKEVQLSQVFGLLESNKAQFEIEDYSFSQTTLEQVFISFAKMQD